MTRHDFRSSIDLGALTSGAGVAVPLDEVMKLFPPRLVTLSVIAHLFGVDVSASSAVGIPAGRDGFRELCINLGCTRGAELGVWRGAHAEALCRLIPNLELLAIDPWTPYAAYREKKNDPVAIAAAYAEAVARLAPYRCTVVRKTSIAASADVADGSLDFVYIDANHEHAHVLADLEAWAPKVRSGGLVSGHDYREAPPEKPFLQVKGAVDQYVHAHGLSPLFILASDRSPSFFWVVP